MKFLKKYTFVRVFHGKEEMVVMRDNDAGKTFIITRKKYLEMKDYFDSTLYVYWESGDKD